MKQVLSCIQPTGEMHLGNYFGAVKNWVDLQAKYDCIYGVVDYHAMTMPYDAKKLRLNTWDLIINLMSVGIDPQNLFVQSLVPEHTELSWIFSCMASYGEMTRMTQFKDKSLKVKEEAKDSFISAGLFTYPVLQAADILIYRADYVPIGKDQAQHLELSRNIAQRFNKQFDTEYFVLPEMLFTETPKIASTADPTRKMSKSAGEKHWIGVFAEEKRMTKQIKSAVTDAGDMTIDEATGKREMSAGVANLLLLMKASGKTETHDELVAQYQAGTLRYGDLKGTVAEALVEMTTPFRERKAELLANKKTVKAQIKASSAEIRKTAQQTLREVKEITGLLSPK